MIFQLAAGSHVIMEEHADEIGAFVQVATMAGSVRLVGTLYKNPRKYAHICNLYLSDGYAFMHVFHIFYSVSCNPGCYNRGQCIEPDKCSCLPGYTGKQCEIGQYIIFMPTFQISINLETLQTDIQANSMLGAIFTANLGIKGPSHDYRCLCRQLQ